MFIKFGRSGEGNGILGRNPTGVDILISYFRRVILFSLLTWKSLFLLLPPANLMQKIRMYKKIQPTRKTFFLFWVDFPELLSCVCFTRHGLPFVVAPKKNLTTDSPLFSVEKNCGIAVDSVSKNLVTIRIFCQHFWSFELHLQNLELLHIFCCYSL